MSKRYYFLKINEDYFRNKFIKKLRKISGGDTFVIIYLKMQLLSLKNGGSLTFDGIEDNLAEELALELDEDTVNVEVTLGFLKSNGLLLESEVDNEFILPETIKSIGSEGASAERVRRFRERKKLEEQGTLNLDEPPKEIKKIQYDEVLHYLNVKTGKITQNKKFQYGRTKKSEPLIKQRWEEGRKNGLTETEILESFHACIDNSFLYWKLQGDDLSNMKPETIFNGAFWERVRNERWNGVKKNITQPEIRKFGN